VSDDKIVMRGLAFYGYHGVVPEEKRLGQRFIVDIEMTCDMRDAARTDDLARTIDYVTVHRDVREIVEGPSLNLIETVAERIAERILASFAADSVRVCVRKPDVPIPAAPDSVGVEITRRRVSKAGK
jgi:dihydroneopterin aldolase